MLVALKPLRYQFEQFVADKTRLQKEIKKKNEAKIFTQTKNIGH